MSAAARLLATIEARAGTVRTDGDRIGVRPSSVLDDALRGELQVHRKELLDLLRGGTPLSLSPRNTATLQHPAAERAEWQHRFEERAGVLQYEAGLPRVDAEREAFLDLAVDWVLANPSANALGNAEAEAAAIDALLRLGVPDPRRHDREPCGRGGKFPSARRRGRASARGRAAR